MNPIFEYETVEIHSGEGGYSIIGPDELKAETTESINLLMKMIPNMMQDPERGGWETYSTTIFSGVVVFSIKRRLSSLLLPPGVGQKVF